MKLSPEKWENKMQKFRRSSTLKISQTENFGKFFLCVCLSFILAKKKNSGVIAFRLFGR